LFTLAAGPVAGQEIQFESRVHDFGSLETGNLLKYDFVFTNAGDDLLTVSNVQASCGCTTVGPWTKQVEPGKTGLIPIQLNSSRIGGSIDVSIRVTSNDRQQPSVELRLHGKVPETMEVRPRFALFVLPGDLASNATRMLDITNNSRLPVNLRPPTINVSHFTAGIKTNVPGWDYQLIIRLISPPVPGEAQGLISIPTSCKDQPILAISAITVIPSVAGSSESSGTNIVTNLPALSARLPEYQKIDGLQASDLFHNPRYAQHRIIFIDARNHQDYKAGHIPGAYEFDPYHPEKYLAAVLPACQAAEQVMVYCAGRNCEDSEFAANLLRDDGIANQKLSVYVGGMTGWIALPMPVEVGAQNSGKLPKTGNLP
jgi:rhodanese-related sulfurtransferase